VQRRFSAANGGDNREGGSMRKKIQTEDMSNHSSRRLIRDLLER